MPAGAEMVVVGPGGSGPIGPAVAAAFAAIASAQTVTSSMVERRTHAELSFPDG